MNAHVPPPRQDEPSRRFELALLDPRATPDVFGIIPSFLDLDDPRSTVEQIDDNYSHGGGWQPIQGFKMDARAVLSYPGDPPFKPLGCIWFRDDLLFVYQFSIVALVSKGSNDFTVVRMD